MANHEDFMKAAIEEANRSAQIGGLPTGSVIVKNGEIIARGIGQVAQDIDPTSHSDIVVIREACKTQETTDLSDCTLYTTIEPCSMCVSAAFWANLPKIVFGARKENFDQNSYGNKNYHAKDFAQSITLINGSSLEVIGGILEDECKELMVNVVNWAV